MRLSINNQDGNGFLDYTVAVMPTGPLTIRRETGALTLCQATLDVSGSRLPVPVLRASVLVQTEAGALLFRGNVTGAPHLSMPVETSESEVTPVHIVATESGFESGPPAVPALQPATSQARVLRLEDEAIRLRDAQEHALPLLPTEITVSGEMSAGNYVTELFQGDGSTTSFPLTATPFRMHGSAKLLQDSFDGPQLAAGRWQVLDTGQHIGLGSGGLKVTGGNSLDGQTVLRAAQPLELGGTLTVELSSVALQAGSDGVVLGLYSNAVGIATCIAGLRVKGTAGMQAIVPLVNGAEAGTPFAFAEGHLYTLRLRLHCAEVQRVRQTYQAVVDGALQSFGGGLVEAPLRLVFEIRDQGLASSTAATVLYAGTMASSPALAIFAPVNSMALQMQAGACRLQGGGSGWVVSTLSDGTVVPRREAAPEEGGDFALNGPALHFFPGRAPLPGEQVSVSYRRSVRACARVQNADASATAQMAGLASSSPWSGAVATHAPRSTADCVAAAWALFAFSSAASTGKAGSCTLYPQPPESAPEPGDRLLVPAAAGAAALQLPVTRAVLTDEHAVPEVVRCDVECAQHSGNGLSFHISQTFAPDVPQPVPVNDAAALAGLPNLQVTGISGSALQMDAGEFAPNGGGFEVRRRDSGFGAAVPAGAVDADLVLRSPVRGFSIPRLGFAERFYVRMFDGSSPANYSDVSAVVVTHWPAN